MKSYFGKEGSKYELREDQREDQQKQSGLILKIITIHNPST